MATRAGVAEVQRCSGAQPGQAIPDALVKGLSGCYCNPHLSPQLPFRVRNLFPVPEPRGRETLHTLIPAERNSNQDGGGNVL